MTSEADFEELKDSLVRLSGVQAVGESRYKGEPCLKVYFENEIALNSTTLPKHPTIRIVAVVSGKIVPQ